jgi:protein-tyrosine phosphatase
MSFVSGVKLEPVRGVPVSSATPFVADAGGLPMDGRTIRHGQLLRVAGDLVGRDDLRSLEALGVRAYIDLRGTGEDRTRLARWARRARVEYVSVPIGVAGGRDLMRRILVSGGGRAQMLALYRTIVDEHGAELARAVGLIAGRTPVAFGCAAGKDRTGVLAALMQSALAVPDEHIARSYVGSAPPAERFAAALQKEFDVPPWMLRLRGAQALLGAQEPTILATLAHVRSTHGSAEGYLLAHGLEAECLTALREGLAT